MTWVVVVRWWQSLDSTCIFPPPKESCLLLDPLQAGSQAFLYHHTPPLPSLAFQSQRGKTLGHSGPPWAIHFPIRSAHPEHLPATWRFGIDVALGASSRGLLGFSFHQPGAREPRGTAKALLLLGGCNGRAAESWVLPGHQPALECGVCGACDPRTNRNPVAAFLPLPCLCAFYYLGELHTFRACHGLHQDKPPKGRRNILN